MEDCNRDQVASECGGQEQLTPLDFGNANLLSFLFSFQFIHSFIHQSIDSTIRPYIHAFVSSFPEEIPRNNEPFGETETG